MNNLSLSFSRQASSLLNEKALSFLSETDKKIFIVVFLALAVVAACCLTLYCAVSRWERKIKKIIVYNNTNPLIVNPANPQQKSNV